VLRSSLFAVLLCACGLAAAQTPAPAAPAEAPLPPLRVSDTVVGTGAEALPGAIVYVYYTGWLLDPSAPGQRGKQFDTSLGKPPFSFPLGARKVIRGWDQGVEGMKVGGKRTLVIPSHLAYGKRGAGGGVIPPDADLVFDVELVDVKQVDVK
jgi:FKBP-type peptidyl-prolyl cis-trans isomerase FkpA